MSIISLFQKIDRKITISCLILLITLFSLAVFPGYEVFTGDQEVYIPQIYHLRNPSLLSNDLSMNVDLLKYTFFDELIDIVKNTLQVDIFTAIFILTAVIRFIYYYSIYKLAFYFSKDRIYSFLAVLLFISGFFIYGYPYSILDTILVPRLISLSFCLLSLAYFLNNLKLRSLTSLLLATLIHPITSLPFIIFFILSILFTSIKFNSKYLSIALIFIILIAYYLINSRIFLLKSIFTPLDPLWESIIKYKNPYYFIFSWNFQLLVLLGNVILFIIALQESKKLFADPLKRKYIYLLFFIPLVLLFFYFVTVEHSKLLFFITLQLLRSLALWKIFGILFFSFFAYAYIKKHPVDMRINFFLIGISTSFVFKESFIYPLPVKESLIWLFLPGFTYIWLKNKYNLLNIKQEKNRYQELAVLFLIILFTFALSRLLLIRIAQLVPFILFVSIITLIIKFGTRTIKKYQYLFKPIFVIILSILITLSLSNFTIKPKYMENKPFIEACNWIKNNTNDKAIFITEPFSNMTSFLRGACLKSVWVSYKDGSLGQFKREYAFEWKKRIDLLNKLKDNYEFLPQILNQYYVDYIFSEQKLPINYPEIFNNNKYFIYKIN